MLIWAWGLVIWLALFWSKMVKKVGSEVVQLSIVAAFSVNFSAALTVVIASQAGIPVSSTHIAIWAIVWVWLYREMSSKINQWINKIQKKIKDGEVEIYDLEVEAEKLITEKKETFKKYQALDEEYDIYKDTISKKKEEDEHYSKAIDEEVQLKRYNRELKHFLEQNDEFDVKISALNSNIATQIEDLRMRRVCTCLIWKRILCRKRFCKKNRYHMDHNCSKCTMNISNHIYSIKMIFYSIILNK